MEVLQPHRLRRWVNCHIFRRAAYRNTDPTQAAATVDLSTTMNVTTLPAQAPVAKPGDVSAPAYIPICLICTSTESPTKPLIKPCRSCTSTYCTDCVRTTFMRALEKPMWNMPAKCCCRMMPLNIGLKYLTKEEARQYRAGFEEWSTSGKDRVYCPNLACLKFIPLKLMGKARPAAALVVHAKTDDASKRDSKDVAVLLPTVQEAETAAPTTVEDVECPNCSTAVCLDCKSFAHPNEPCGADNNREVLLAQLKEWGYKQCPRCNHGVRRMYGCSHMQCVCGEHFCWSCGRIYEVCEREGDCADQEDSDCDDDDDCDAAECAANGEPIQPAEAIEVTGDGMVAPTVPAIPDGAPPVVEQNEAGPAVVVEVVQAPQRRRNRVENLDSGGDRYWANQELDFGDEPTDPGNVVFNCQHAWEAMANVEKDAEDLIECHDCWKTIPEKPWECSWCFKVACDTCKELVHE